jgi:small subunit ribosomal protein S6e
MKLNVAYGRHGTVKSFEIAEDQVRRSGILGKRLGVEVEGSVFGEQFTGYSFKIRGGQDTEGFPMMFGVCAPARVSLLLKRGAVGFNAFRARSGERRRKAIRGDIIGEDISVLNLVITKIGAKPLEGVTDVSHPRALGPKRVSAIRKLWSLPRNADVRKFVVKRKVSKAGKKDRFKGPRVQRLITSKVRAARVKKVKVQKEQLKESAAERREFLTTITRDRMKHRQTKLATASRVKAAKKI